MLNIPSNPPKMSPRVERSRLREALESALGQCAAFDGRTDPDAPRPEVEAVELEPLVKFTAAVFRVRLRLVALAVLRIRAGGATPRTGGR